jgi:hypothetical protein
MSASGSDGHPKFLSLPVEIYNYWLPPVLHQKQATLLSALKVGTVPHSSNQSARHLFHILSLQGMMRAGSSRSCRHIEPCEEVFDANVFFHLDKQRQYAVEFLYDEDEARS